MYKNCHLCVKTAAVWLVWLQGSQHHACITWTARYLFWVWIPWMQFSGRFGCKSINIQEVWSLQWDYLQVPLEAIFSSHSQSSNPTSYAFFLLIRCSHPIEFWVLLALAVQRIEGLPSWAVLGQILEGKWATGETLKFNSKQASTWARLPWQLLVVFAEKAKLYAIPNRSSTFSSPIPSWWLGIL